MSERKRPSLGAPRTEGRPEVELYDRIFVTRPVTKSVQKNLEPVLEKLNGAQAADAAMLAIAEGLDLLLMPANGQRTSASKLVQENWDAEKLELGDLVVFFEDIQELTTRPT